MSEHDVSEQRNKLVVKSNELIQKTRYSLSVQEQKIILYLISMIKPTDEKFQIYQLSMGDLCEICGITQNGKNYYRFRESIKSLADKSFWISTPERDILMRWIEHVEIVKRDKVVEIRIDDTLKPYLLALKDNYTQYELGYVLVLKSKYSIRLYEMLKSYAYIGEKDYSLDELKNALQIDGYDEFRYLKRDIIDKSLSEINAHTDLQIEYKTYRTGRSIGGLVFDISKKSNVQQVVLRVKRDALLDPKTKKE